MKVQFEDFRSNKASDSAWCPFLNFACKFRTATMPILLASLQYVYGLMAIGFESSESFIIFYSNSMTKIAISIVWKIRINVLDLLESSWFIIKPTIFEPGANSSESVHMYAQVCIKILGSVAISMISTHAPINMLTFWTHDHWPA